MQAKLGNAEFQMQSATRRLGDTDIRLEIYTCVRRGYALTFVLSFTTEGESYRKLLGVLDSLKLR